MKALIPNRVAVILYALVMAIFGIFHFMNAAAMAAAVPIPGGAVWIYITGAGLLLAGIAFIINKQARLAGYLLAIFLLLTIVLVHAPMAAKGDQMATTMLLKDVGLLAGAILIANSGK